MRSIDQTDGTPPTAGVIDPRLSSSEDVQVRAAETMNHSPSAALPVPRADRTEDIDLEHGELDLLPSPTNEERLVAPRRERNRVLMAVRATDTTRLASQHSQSLPERRR